MHKGDKQSRVKMREKSSTLSKNKRRHRSSSGSSSSDSRKPPHELSDLENNPSKYGGEKLRRKCSPKELSSTSCSEPDIERNFEKKRKKHVHHKKKEARNSDCEDEHNKDIKGKTSHSHKTGDKYKSRNEQELNKNRERERQEYKNTKSNQKNQEQHLSSEYKAVGQHRRKERHHDEEDDAGRRRDGGSGRYAERRMDSFDNDRRLHSNVRSQDRRDEGNGRRHVGENVRREGHRRFQGEGERRNRWSDGGEGSRGGGSRRHRNSNEGDQSVSFDRDRPIKQEPGLNNDESENYEWGRKPADGSKPGGTNSKDKDASKDKPNFGLSGKLTEDTNTVNGVVIKYSEPPEARKPRRRWRLYVFKGEENLPTLYLHRQSCFLIGRDRKVVDIPVDHPSCSKQHAAFQFRLVPYQRVNGTMGKRVRPYIIDLESANGTFVNNNRIDSKKYVELLERDVMKFGFSSREYVLLHEQSKESEAEDDDVVGT